MGVDSTNWYAQAVAAESRREAEFKRIEELAKKHNVTLEWVGDEVMVDGSPDAVFDFITEQIEGMETPPIEEKS